MSEPTTYQDLPEDAPFSLKQQWTIVQDALRYVLSHWRYLVIAALAGALLGLGYLWIKPVKYTARISFVVEESKMGGGNLVSALAGQFGFDIGSMSGSNGILAGDNVLQLLKSHTLIRKTLLTPYDSTGKNLADAYAEIYGLKRKWEKKQKVGRWVNFNQQKPLNRTEDSLLQTVITKILKEDLAISKPDRKLGFFELTASMRDETLSLLFCRRLLSVTTDFYIDTKTRRLKNNVLRLQAKADSLAAALNRKTYSAADANRLLLDANPAYASPEVSAEISTRDKFMQSTIYAEIVKNLEISKTAMIQETPTVQVVDEPEVPLPDNALHGWVAATAGAFAAIIAMALAVLVLRKKKS